MFQSKKTLAYLFLGLSWFAQSAFADAPEESVRMLNANKAVIEYADKCSNGANITDSGREKFLELSFADQKSLLASLKRFIIGNDEDLRFALTDWQQVFHERMGCGQNENRYSAFAVKIERGNSNKTVAMARVEIIDNDEQGQRSLEVAKVEVLNLKPEVTHCGPVQDYGDSLRIIDHRLNPYLSFDTSVWDPKDVRYSLVKAVPQGACACVKGSVEPFDIGSRRRYEFKSVSSWTRCK